MVKLSHPYLTMGKTIALTTWTCVSKMMSLLFNTLSRFIISLLPRSKHLLISWLQSPSAVILEPKKIQFVTVSSKVSFIMCVCAKLLQSCPTLSDPMDCSPPGFSVHGIFQATILELVAAGKEQISQDGMVRSSHPIIL